MRRRRRRSTRPWRSASPGSSGFGSADASDFIDGLGAQSLLPLYAWQQWRLARSNDDPVPEWVAKWFDEIAERLDKLAVSPPDRDIAKAVAEAFGFSAQARGHSPFADVRKAKEGRDWLARYMASRVLGMDHAPALAAVAKSRRVAATATTIGRRLDWLAAQVGLSVEQLVEGLRADARRRTDEFLAMAVTPPSPDHVGPRRRS